MTTPNKDIASFKMYTSIATKLNLQHEDIDGSEFAERFTMEEMVILQKELAKAMEYKLGMR